MALSKSTTHRHNFHIFLCDHLICVCLPTNLSFVRTSAVSFFVHYVSRVLHSARHMLDIC